MKISTLYKLWLSLVIVLALSACNSKTTQGETNSTAIDNPITQTEGDTSSDRENTTVANGTKNDGTSGKTTVSPNVKNPSMNSRPSTSAGNGGHGTEGTIQNTTTQSGGENNTADHTTSDEDGDSNTHTESGDSTTNDNGTNTSTGSDDNSTQMDSNTSAGEEGNTTTGGNDSTDTNTTTPTTTLKSLNLTVDKTSLNKDENTTLKVMVTYSNNTSKEVTDKVEWVTVPNNTVKVTNTTLTALQDKATTLKAKVDTILSNAIDLNITWTVNGHTLPPEPDPQMNNATLLGVDVNNNGVRDDVERWIYKTYDHPIERGIVLQGAKAYTSLLKTKPIKHKENGEINNVFMCVFYWEDNNKYISQKYEYEYFFKELKKIQFNTVKRLVAKRKYEMSLSGGVYSLSKADKSKCEFDENGTLKAQQ